MDYHISHFWRTRLIVVQPDRPGVILGFVAKVILLGEVISKYKPTTANHSYTFNMWRWRPAVYHGQDANATAPARFRRILIPMLHIVCH